MEDDVFRVSRMAERFDLEAEEANSPRPGGKEPPRVETADGCSFWQQTAPADGYPAVTSDAETEFLIIGGGITGVSCAYSLALRGKNPVLIEAGALCGGTTGKTTGKATAQHGLLYARLIREYGRDAARLYAKAQLEGLDSIRRAVQTEQIACSFTDCTSYVYAANPADEAPVREEYEAARGLGLDAVLDEERFPSGSLLRFGLRGQAVLHPVLYVQGLAAAARRAGARIFCGTKAVRVEEGEPVCVFCENGAVLRAKRVIQATQYPIYDGAGGFYFARLYPRREYGIAAQTQRNFPDGAFLSAGEPARSLRAYAENGRRVLIAVGDGYPTGHKDDLRAPHFEHLEEFARQEAGAERTLSRWAAQDYGTPDGLPYIGRLSAKSDLLLAAGFDRWGITNGAFAGLLLSDLLTMGGSRYEELFSPARGGIAAAPGRFAAGALGAVGELFKSKFETAEEMRGIRTGEGRVVRFRGRRAGLYVDEEGTAFVVDIACTHMGTQLRFNPAERTWDCPAHGGRFRPDGELLEGPPKDSLPLLYKGPLDALAKAGEQAGAREETSGKTGK